MIHDVINFILGRTQSKEAAVVREQNRNELEKESLQRQLTNISDRTIRRI